ncbi:ABC transporter ATP-binding protein [Devosia nitrariae]|uniref:ABC transporter ATP-binding protein n=1 Tax=Devosia nitrariae TaxID=2071872 RepID=A0ABQ5WF07_9HYPH|nr:ABC transporter ATP-binding protein [Devosia nitrariae]GLQ58090.1 ABC transporter ATP-binding protein [Devosia nitrariae]
MARITLEDLAHTYFDPAEGDVEWAVRRLDLEWADGGAFALLGPSGCGKTTLLNIMSGLLRPTRGRILFDDRDVTGLSPEARNIAQVFQFPVVYDTMSVYDNIAFPLRNRGMAEAEIAPRVAEIAELTELTPMLRQRAAGLTADGKQKISLARGLVRPDVNLVMFDEPLTVIDPHLKWVLRSKLRELHQRVRTTMIYVTHDQTEALTFADQVVVMNAGEVVQIGTPVELFEQPQHTFVGHFIGSPGMNVLPAKIENGTALFGGQPVEVANPVAAAEGVVELGIRPEFVRFAPTGIPATVTNVADAGRYRIIDTESRGHSIKLLVDEGEPIPSGAVNLGFAPGQTRLYRDGWLIGGAGR